MPRTSGLQSPIMELTGNPRETVQVNQDADQSQATVRRFSHVDSIQVANISLLGQWTEASCSGALMALAKITVY